MLAAVTPFIPNRSGFAVAFTGIYQVLLSFILWAREKEKPLWKGSGGVSCVCWAL